MSGNTDPNPGSGGAPPTAAPIAITPPAQAGAPSGGTEPSRSAAVNMTSEQLTQRLDESRKSAMASLLKDLGFEKADDAKAALKKLKDLETASLTEQEKAAKRIKELEPLVAAGAANAELIKSLVDEQFNALPAHVQAVVDAEAKGDPAKRLSAMRLIKAASAPAPGTPPPAPAPGNLGPPPAPPPSGAPTAFQQWEQMKARSPMAGDIFFQNNRAEIERTRPSA